MKIKLSPARELDFGVLDIPNSIPKQPISAQNRVKIAQNRSWQLFWSDFHPANVPKSVQERPKGVQKRPKSVSGSPKNAPRVTQERFHRLYLVVYGCIWLHLVVVQRRWEADGEGGER